MDISDLYQRFLQFPSVTTDTRSVKEGDIFFALKGPNFNGNKFAKAALSMGAALCVCDEKTDADDAKVFYTDDVLATLQALAKHHREQFSFPVIAITGSNGKTTTKELLHAVLEKKYRCAVTKGNYNNHIGVPLTILSIKKDAEIAVIEMGANHLQEIAGYCRYTMPTHGLITNCGKAHLEGFGSEAGVRKAKGELYDYLAAHDGTIFINNDYDYLQEMGAQVKKQISYGSGDATFRGKIKSSGHFAEAELISGARIPSLQTKLAGAYNLPNILSAVAIGRTFGVADDDIKMAIEGYTPSNSRSQIIKKGTNTILLDAYNANPASMKAAIENFAAMQGDNKAVFLGGMKEMGDDSDNEHGALIELLGQHEWKTVALAGEEFKDPPEQYFHFKTSDELAEWFRRQRFENTLMLIKGSRGMAMERLLSEA